MKYIYLFLITAATSISCFAANTARIRVNSYEIIMQTNGDYVVKKGNSKIIVNKVRVFIMFCGDPYFETGDWKIIKGIQTISDNSSNLQIFCNKLYFQKEYAEGAEPDSVSLNVIDSTGKRKEIIIKDNKKPIIIDGYSYFGNYYIFDDYPRLCVTDTLGNVLKIIPVFKE